MGSIKILVVGDIVGEPGRRVCKELIPELRENKGIDFVIANAENCAGGSGVTMATAQELFDAGINVLTSGDHIFKRKEVYEYIKKNKNLLRPANYPTGAPGIGSNIYTVSDSVKIGVINLLGTVFLSPINCPFQIVDQLIKKMRERNVNIIVIDFHAEATSEKVALGWYLNGKVSGVCGSHTHIQTADETILSKGTAYITDVGMSGPFRSVLGRDVDAVLTKFITQMPSHLKVATEDLRLNGVIIEVDVQSGRARSIERIQRRLET